MERENIIESPRREPFRATLLAALVVLVVSGSSRAQVVINEVLASNRNTSVDEDGDSSDWLEICNTSTVQVDLDGWFLTDDALELTKWTLPDVSLPPGAYLV
ncbi:MAG: lamin tail domain-containing protein, partial [Planctomycetota bacterium]|nr:lamin tail domain-containing protein [Planctomycetota bacterium]